MTYYNYHGTARKLISNGHCSHAEFVQSYKNISPALILFFDNHKPMPIRKKCFDEYVTLLQFFEIPILNPQAHLDS